MLVRHKRRFGHDRRTFGIDRRQPAVPVGYFALDVCEVLPLNPFGDRSATTRTNDDAIDAADRGHLGGGSGEEDFIGDVERFTGQEPLDDFEAEVAADPDDGVAGDPRPDRRTEGGWEGLAVRDEEDGSAAARAH